MTQSAAFASSFYVTGGTVPRDAACYVTRKADLDLLEGLRQGQFCYVLTSRQMGKSSLMVRTAMRLREEGVICVVLDLTAIGQNLDPERWYGGLLNQLGQQVGLEDQLDDAWFAPSALGPMQRWRKCLQDVVLRGLPGKLVIFIDEIDAVRSLPFSADEFFAGIRECYNRRAEDPDFERLTFCLLGVATPADLIRDPRTTPFNIGRRIDLTDFSEAEASPLALGLTYLLDGEPIFLQRTEAEVLLKRVLYWTGGHPYLTQRFCSVLAEHSVGMLRGDALVDRFCSELFLSSSARERDDNLLFVRERLLRSEVDLAGLLLLYRAVWEGKRVQVDETSPFISLLRLSGITHVANGLLKPRNRIYARVFDKAWVAANMPDAEVRRQKAAYRRGIARAVGISGAVVALIAALGGVAVWNAIRADKAAALARVQAAAAERMLYIADMNLIQQAWEAAPPDTGRVLDLLEETRPYKDRGFEWYYWNRLCHLDLHTFTGGKGAVASVVFSPDDKRILTTNPDGSVRILDADSGEESLRFRDAEPGTESLSRSTVFASTVFSPEGRRILTNEENRRATLWDSLTGRKIWTLHEPELNYVACGAAFSPDGRRIVRASGETARVFDAANGSEIRLLKLDEACENPCEESSYVTSLAFSPDGKQILTGSEDMTARLWDAGSGTEIRSFKGGKRSRGYYSLVAFSPDGKRIVTSCRETAFPSSREMTAKIWDAATGRELLHLNAHADVVGSVAFAPDGRSVLIGCDTTAQMFDADNGKKLLTLRGHTARVVCAAFSRDGSKVVTGSLDGTVKLWDARHERAHLALPGHRANVHVGFSADNRRIVSLSDDTRLIVWDAATGHPELTVKPTDKETNIIALSPDGSRAVSLNEAGTLLVRDLQTGGVVRALSHDNPYNGDPLALSRGGDRLVVGVVSENDHKMTVWDVATGNVVFALPCLDGSITVVAFSPNGERLLVGSHGRLSLLNSSTGRKLLDIGLPRTAEDRNFDLTQGGGDVLSACFSPDGTQFVTIGAGMPVIVWDAATGRRLVSLRGHLSADSAVFSPDGKRILTSGSDGTARLWDADVGREVLTLKGHTDGVASAAFSPDGKRIVTGGGTSGVVGAHTSHIGEGYPPVSSDFTVRVWYSDDADTQMAWSRHKGAARGF